MSDKRVTQGGGFLISDASLEETFTPEDFNDLHKDIGNAVEDFVKGKIADLGDEVEKINNHLSRELMREAGKLGFLGIDVPEEYGGMELDKISSAIVSERLGYGAGSFAVTELNHTGIGMLPLVFFGSQQQKEKYLPGLTSGHLIGAFALTEPNAGSDALNSSSIATLTSDGKYYILNGNKQFITNAGFADIIFTYAKVDGKFFTAFIVEQNWEGVSVGDEEEKMGMKGTSTRAYYFENVKIPVENVLGEVGKGHLVALNALNMGRFKVGAICVGSARRSLDEAIKYAKQRTQFGQPICHFGLIKEKLANMVTRLFAAQSMLFRTAGLIQSDLDDQEIGSDDYGTKTAKALENYLIECSINKIYGSETESLIVDEEVQIFGGYGYIYGNHPEVAYRNARINKIWEGTNEINRLVIVNTLLRRISKGDYDLITNFQRVKKEFDQFEEVKSDEPKNLAAQQKLLDLAKKIAIFAFGSAYQKYGNSLREEQEVIGCISNIIIEIFAMESSLLRAMKILNKKDIEKYDVVIKIIKVLFYDATNRIGLCAKEILEMTEDNNNLEKYLVKIRDLMTSPPIKMISLKKEIGEIMVKYGRYFL